jgi:hypothetical protein
VRRRPSFKAGEGKFSGRRSAGWGADAQLFCVGQRRPQAWLVAPPGAGLPGRLTKSSYLGSGYECTFETELGAVFVVSSDLARPIAPGTDVGLSLAQHGVSVVAAR